MFLLHLSIPPLPPSALAARAALRAFANEHHLGQRDTEDLTFAVGEAIANAIAHGQATAAIDLDVSIDAESVVATVRDRGRGCERLPPGLAQLPQLLATHGRGFAIMQRFTDVCEIESEAGHGTTVRLERRRRDNGELAPA